MYVDEHPTVGGGRCARASEEYASGDVVVRDVAIDFERVLTGVERWSCHACGRFLEDVCRALPDDGDASLKSTLVDTREQDCALPEMIVVRGYGGETLASCACRQACAWRHRMDGGAGATAGCTYGESFGVDFSEFETMLKKSSDGQGDDDEENDEYYDRVETMAARLYVAQLLDPDGEKSRAVKEKHADAKSLEDAFVKRADSAVSALRKIIGAVDASRTDEPTVQGWLSVVSAVVLNSVAVKIPNPMLRYIACLDAESEDVRNSAMRTLRPAISQMVENAEESSSSSDDDDDDDSDDAYDGDEHMEFDWGDGLNFTSDLFPSSEGIALLGACSAINHSCEPNCEVGFIDSTDVIIIATRDIDEHEELTIAYVPEELPVDERREELSTRYGFECRCAKCERELAKKAKRTT